MMMRPSTKRRSRLRQPQRPVATHMTTSISTTGNRLLLFCAGLFCISSVAFIPIVMLETMDPKQPSQLKRAEVGVGHLIGNARHFLTDNHSSSSRNHPPQGQQQHIVRVNGPERNPDSPLARGLAGRPMSDTPALIGAKRATIECNVDVNTLAYWNDPQGDRDVQFRSPFAVTEEKYITFAPDRGGWNNVRMSMEIIFLFAAATNRTLVLPPKEPLYLLHHDTADKYRGFADFFPIHTAEFQRRVKVISMKEFLEREGTTRLPIPEENRTAVMGAADHCDKRAASTAACAPIWDYLAATGVNPQVDALNTCLVFDEAMYNGQEPTNSVQSHVNEVCGEKRRVMYWDKTKNEPLLLHFHANENKYRLLTHFYGMIKFTDPAIDNHYKRFVRDFLHYHDTIYCAAGKIVQAVQKEGMSRGFQLDAEGGGGYSALHVRRGDLQYKKVKISALEWYENTKEIWQPNEILYIATDERDKSFFDDLAKHHDLRFLDDYWDMADLGQLDPNYMGMIDTIVASRGRAFAGTWFSTFSGYITRLRGYYGMSMMDTWYSFLPKKTAVHEWKLVNDFAYAYEWPDGWIGIDADVWPSRDKF